MEIATIESREASAGGSDAAPIGHHGVAQVTFAELLDRLFEARILSAHVPSKGLDEPGRSRPAWMSPVLSTIRAHLPGQSPAARLGWRSHLGRTACVVWHTSVVGQPSS